MTAECIHAMIVQVEAMEANVTILRDTAANGDVAASDRQYLSRCFDLLNMELVAVRDYVQGLRQAAD